MSQSKHSIDIWIFMNGSGAFVVGDDPDEAADRADKEFEDDDIRQVQITVRMSPANGTQPPASAEIEIG